MPVWIASLELHNSHSFQLHLFATVDVGKEVEVGKKDEKCCCISNDNLKI